MIKHNLQATKFIVTSRINTVQTPVTIWASNKLTYDQETMHTNNLMKTETMSKFILLVSTKKDFAVVKVMQFAPIKPKFSIALTTE